MVHRKYSAAVGFAFLLTAAQAPLQTVFAADAPMLLAQAPAFKLPNSVPQGTTVRIDGSSSMTAVNDVLKQRFEKQFPGSQINTANTGTPEGLQAVLNGQADLAAIGRPLTAQEKAQGLVAVPVGRDKIAILIGSNNPFAKSLNITQFAKMFRGEIKNWSQVGGPSAPIRFIDRPDSSDTRQAFSNYPVFKQAKFATGPNAEKLTEDTTQAVIQKLGNNGISYSTANQIKNQRGVKTVAMHGTQPTDARYPFSQPLYYVYKGAPNAAVQAFLGYATAPVGQTVIQQAGVATAIAAPAQTTKKATTAKASPAAKAGTNKTAIGTTNAQNPNAPGENSVGFLPSGNPAATNEPGFPNWLWWLLPIASGAALLWMLAKGRRRSTVPADPEGYSTGRFNPPAADFDRNGSSAETTAPDLDGDFAARRDYPEFGSDYSSEELPSNRVQPAPDFAADEANLMSDYTPPTSDVPSTASNLGGAALAGGAAAGAAAWSALSGRGNRQSRVVLKARSPQEVEAFWDIPPEERQAIRQQGGEKLAIRLYDVTDIDLDHQNAHSVQQFDCDELTQRQRLPIANADRDYLVEVGYLTREGQWLAMARSTHVRVPPTSNRFSSATKTGDAVDYSAQKDLADDVYGAASQEPDATISAKRNSEGTDTPTDFGVSSEASTPRTEEPNWFQRATQTASDVASDVTQAGGSAMAGGAAAASGATAAAWSFLSGDRATEQSERNQPLVPEAEPAPQSELRQTEISDLAAPSATNVITGRLTLQPRNAQWAYAYWDIPRTQRAMVDRQPDQNLVLRLYDVTDGNADQFEQFDIDDMALSCDVPIPASDRTYVAEIGYVDSNNQWARLARSTPTTVSAS